ncbi:cupin domain-containing protein [Rhodococcus sp. G-MC3]|uniref:cupin domain-containing protein n=1 Tax=Rhodococcus sp. G-MC3 TaxID=3046209 RepID=UPI0024BBD631|nr:cupin domain-containing protein [Rhodococcus sp. G-MC3]MDJ0394855.1 cupin domain-containing protein [Rhodococcus sp. G-MC3]
MTSPALIPVGSRLIEKMAPSSYVTAETLRSGDPQETEAVHLTSADSKFLTGSWSAQPYTEFIESYPGDEYTRVLEGSVTLTTDGGTPRTFTAGEAFTLTKGWRGEYRVNEPLVKQFAIYVSDEG